MRVWEERGKSRGRDGVRTGAGTRAVVVCPYREGGGGRGC